MGLPPQTLLCCGDARPWPSKSILLFDKRPEPARYLYQLVFSRLNFAASTGLRRLMWKRQASKCGGVFSSLSCSFTQALILFLQLKSESQLDDMIRYKCQQSMINCLGNCHEFGGLLDLFFLFAFLIQVDWQVWLHVADL